MNRFITAFAPLLMLGLATVHLGHHVSLAGDPAVKDKPAKTGSKETGRITGRVVRDEGNSAVAAADVILLPPPPQGQDAYYGNLPLRRVTSGADGSFAFEGLPPGRYSVWANSGKFTSRKSSVRGERVVLTDSDEGPKSVELRLKPAVVVTAQIKSQKTGKPISGATIHIGWSDFPEDAKSDQNGVALLQPLTRERLLLEAWADGFAKSTHWIDLATGSDAEVTFALALGGELGGIVRNSSGEPVQGVGLSVRTEGNNDQLEYVVSGKDGRYRLAHIPVDIPLQVSLSKLGYLDASVAVRLDKSSRELDMSIKPRPHGGSIVGVVMNAQGKPIAGAELRNEGNSTSLVRETKAGPDGRFRLDDLYENFVGKEILVRAPHCCAKRVTVAPGPADHPTEVRIDMEPGHQIKGRVVDENGKPIDGVTVYFAQGENAFSDGGRTTTDRQGAFSFDTLPLDTPFSFHKEGFSQLAGQKLTLDGEGIVSVKMIPVGVIVGRVLDFKTSKPVRKFNVRITFSPKKLPNEPSTGLMSSLVEPGSMYQSDEGKFRLGNLVAKMPLQVMISAEGYERHVAERIVVGLGTASETEEFLLDPIDPASLWTYRGRLLSVDGKPVVGAQLRLIAARERRGDQRGAYPFNWQMIRTGQIAQAAGVTRFIEVTTDNHGRFSVSSIPKDAEVELVWWGKGIAPGRADHLELREDKEREALEFTLPAPGRVTGVVALKAFGQVARVRLSATNDNIEGVELELKPGQQEFEIGDLAAGTYHVSLMSPYERSPMRGMTSKPVASGKVTIDPGGTGRIEFR